MGSLLGEVGETSVLSVWDVLEENPYFFERSNEPTTTEPREHGHIAPYDVLIPRAELGPNVFVLYLQGAFIPASAMPKNEDGGCVAFSEDMQP